jgi:uncharacterized membrane protein
MHFLFCPEADVRRSLSFLIILLLLFFSFPLSKSAQAQEPQVRGLLFFSPTCGHCHTVITEVLPPLADKYGSQLQIAGVDVSHEVGQSLYQAAIQRFNIPDNKLGVPTLIIGEAVLVGSLEIPENLPGLIEAGLENGGVDWPDIPGLKEIMDSQQDTTEASSPTQAQQGETNVSENTPQEQIVSDKATFINRFSQDPIGNSFSVIVLLGMIASVIVVGYSSIKGDETKTLDWPKWVIPLLSIIGIGVAAYLSYVEVTASKAVCGPVGDCNTVQESPYARLFGILPIGVLGMLGYIAILVAWFAQYYGPNATRKFFTLALWGMAWFGILFSIYLTFLEPFVIGATCAWCLTSAVIMTLVLLASTEPAKQALVSNYNDLDSADDTAELEEIIS